MLDTLDTNISKIVYTRIILYLSIVDIFENNNDHNTWYRFLNRDHYIKIDNHFQFFILKYYYKRT